MYIASTSKSYIYLVCIYFRIAKRRSRVRPTSTASRTSPVAGPAPGSSRSNAQTNLTSNIQIICRNPPSYLMLSIHCFNQLCAWIQTCEDENAWSRAIKLLSGGLPHMTSADKGRSQQYTKYVDKQYKYRDFFDGAVKSFQVEIIYGSPSQWNGVRLLEWQPTRR